MLNKDFKRIVIKIGSSIILNNNGSINNAVLRSLATDIYSLHKSKEIIIVSSGAIGIGKTILKVKKASDLSEKQALAAVGQAHLIQIYEKLFSKFGIKVGQVLLTREDLQDKKRYQNVRNTLLRLIKHGIIPIINENDTVATEEIKIGDNDNLSALVASKIDACLLIILSDIEGVYEDPSKRSRGIVKKVTNIDKFLKDFKISLKKSAFGTGGIATKIQAARIMAKKKLPTVIAAGNKRGIISKILKEKNAGTWFVEN